MKKRILILISSAIVIVSLYMNYDNQKIKINKDDLSIIIPNSKSQKIKKDFIDKATQIIEIVKEDTKDGYTIGLDTPSLSKTGVKKLYDYLKQYEVCIDDEQGYYDLENVNVFEDFWNCYMQNIECHFVYYTILQTGNIERADYYYEHDILYVIKCSLNIEDEENPIVEDMYGREIQNAYYENGFFYYRRIISETMKKYGIIEYEYIRIEPLGEKNREYTQKYIHTIDYQCTNIFTENWDSHSLNVVNYSDLFEYLYELKYQSPFYATEMDYTLDPFVKKIPADYFEKLIQEYFDITSNVIKQYCVYDKNEDIYPWREGYCVASKFQTPCFKGEVVDIEEKDNSIILTVNAHGYEYGYSHGFTHKVYIQKYKTGFHYVGNEIIDSSDNHIPEYSPGVTCQSIKK